MTAMYKHEQYKRLRRRADDRLLKVMGAELAECLEDYLWLEDLELAMTTTTTQPMTRDEFYEKFPWVFSLPERPQCNECLMTSLYVIRDGWMLLSESHTDDCSRKHGVETPVYQQPEARR